MTILVRMAAAAVIIVLIAHAHIAIIGDVVALHHRMPFSGTSRGLPEQLRGLLDDGSRLFIGECALAGARDPNCYLAPSIDDGQTRRLIAIAPIAEGELWRLPLSGTGTLYARRDIERALASAGEAHEVPGRDMVRTSSPAKGRGVFAHRAYASGERIAAWPCAIIRETDAPHDLADYLYDGVQPNTRLVVFGHGMLYNHDASPNIRAHKRVQDGDASPSWDPDTSATVSFFALRDIRAGEELVQDYGEEWWQSRQANPPQS